MASVSVIGVQIPANEALTGMIDLGTHNLMAIEMPENYDGTTLTFQSKAERSVTSAESTEDWDDVYNDAGTEVSITVAANRIVGLRADVANALSALRFIRIRSGTSASPQNQNPAVNLRLIVKQA